jgi:hypothetical protein
VLQSPNTAEIALHHRPLFYIKVKLWLDHPDGKYAYILLQTKTCIPPGLDLT